MGSLSCVRFAALLFLVHIVAADIVSGSDQSSSVRQRHELPHRQQSIPALETKPSAANPTSSLRNKPLSIKRNDIPSQEDYYKFLLDEKKRSDEAGGQGETIADDSDGYFHFLMGDKRHAEVSDDARGDKDVEEKRGRMSLSAGRPQHPRHGAKRRRRSEDSGTNHQRMNYDEFLMNDKKRNDGHLGTAASSAREFDVEKKTGDDTRMNFDDFLLGEKKREQNGDDTMASWDDFVIGKKSNHHNEDLASSWDDFVVGKKSIHQGEDDMASSSWDDFVIGKKSDEGSQMNFDEFLLGEKKREAAGGDNNTPI